MPKGGAGKTKLAVSLTHRAIEAMRPEAEAYRVPDLRRRGLAIRVAPSGAKTFDFACRVKGSRTGIRTSLGEFPQVGLDEAGNRAAALHKAAREGRNLLEEEKAARAERDRRITVANLIEEYARRELRGKLRTAKEIERRLTRAMHQHLGRAADDLVRRDLRETFEAVADAGLLREAEKRRQTVGAMYRWAVGRDLVVADPTAGLKAFDAGAPRERVFSTQEIRAFWVWLESGAMPEAYAEILRLQLLTGSRCGEVSGMDASEIDETAWLWKLPAARSKNGRERVTPIIGQAREILQRWRPKAGPLFTSATGRTITSTHVGQVLINRRTRLPVPHFTSHDLRRTFATCLSDMGVPQETIAAIVGHEASAGRETRTLVRHYVHTDRLDRKRVALEAWDAQLRSIISDTEPGSNVITLQRTA